MASKRQLLSRLKQKWGKSSCRVRSWVKQKKLCDHRQRATRGLPDCWTRGGVEGPNLPCTWRACDKVARPLSKAEHWFPLQIFLARRISVCNRFYIEKRPVRLRKGVKLAVSWPKSKADEEACTTQCKEGRKVGNVLPCCRVERWATQLPQAACTNLIQLDSRGKSITVLSSKSPMDECSKTAKRLTIYLKSKWMTMIDCTGAA